MSPLSPLAPALARLRATIARTVLVRGGAATWRWQLPIVPLAPLAWLHAQTVPGRFFWAERDRLHETAGAGVADQVEAAGPLAVSEVFRLLRSRLAGASPQLRYFGGHAFSPTTDRDPHWQAFGAARFLLPMVEICRDETGCTLAVNLAVRAGHDPELARQALLDTLDRLTVEAPDFALSPVDVRAAADCPTQPAWERLVRLSLERCRQGLLDKVVLARCRDLSLAVPPAPTALLAALRQLSPHTFTFLLQPGDGPAFLGATPELLYARAGRSILSEAVAGTRPRGATAESDERYARELLTAAKDSREHRLVTSGILRSLAGLCRSVAAHEPPSLLRLGHVQHLHQGIAGALHPRIDDADLLGALHPTPAVGGAPRGDALRTIAELEPFDRGWYAGPVGWIGAAAARFAVAIRSGLLHGDRLRLYAGAGLLPGSDPAAEWAELDAKLAGFRRALAAELPQPARAAAPAHRHLAAG